MTNTGYKLSDSQRQYEKKSKVKTEHNSTMQHLKQPIKHNKKTDQSLTDATTGGSFPVTSTGGTTTQLP